MFYKLKLTKELEVHPRLFGPNLKEKLEEMLVKEVEGSCDGQRGFVIFVSGLDDIGKGMIREGTGYATFTVRYSCVVFRPFKGEVLDAIITSVNQMGFFAEAGPVQIFVSNHLITDDYEFQSGDQMSFVSTSDGLPIRAGADVRLRVVGTRVDASEIFCIGTINENFLGVFGA